MLIPKINISNKSDIEEVAKQLDQLERRAIAHQNWTNYDQAPTVSFQIAHDGANIYLKYDVSESELRAVATENNGKVWEDSCVEFFIAFDDSGFYYNLEQSCIGTTLLGYRKDRENPTRSTDQIIDAIVRKSTLPNKSFDLKKGEFTWSLVSIIPISSFWVSNLKSFDGIKAKANFYKCGDKLSHPHYLSWSPVAIEKPNFHRVDFFKEIIFA